MRTPYSAARFLLLIFVLLLALLVIYFGVFALALDKLGLSARAALLLLGCTLFGSAINLPLFQISATAPPDEARPPPGMLFGRMPPFTGKTVVAINVGGAIIPLLFSIYLARINPLPPGRVALAVALARLVAADSCSRP